MVILSFSEASVMKQPFKSQRGIRFFVFYLFVFVVAVVFVIVFREMGCVVSLTQSLSKHKNVTT